MRLCFIYWPHKWRFTWTYSILPRRNEQQRIWFTLRFVFFSELETIPSSSSNASFPRMMKHALWLGCIVTSCGSKLSMLHFLMFPIRLNAFTCVDYVNIYAYITRIVQEWETKRKRKKWSYFLWKYATWLGGVIGPHTHTPAFIREKKLKY